MVNAKCQYARTIEQLKSKFENLKTKARKTVAGYTKNIKGTGGGPPIYLETDPVIEAVLRIINYKTVVGLQNNFDCDSDHFMVEIFDVRNINLFKIC